MSHHVVTRPGGFGGSSTVSGSFAPVDASYLVLTASSELTNERVIVRGPGIQLIDNGTTIVAQINGQWHETPSGSIDSSNTIFTTEFPPAPRESLQVFRRGLHMASGSSALECDYYLSGTNTIVMKRAPNPGEPFFVHYFYTPVV